MRQEEIFRLLLLVLFAGNAESDDCSVFGRLNNILIIGLLMELGRDDNNTTNSTMTTF